MKLWAASQFLEQMKEALFCLQEEWSAMVSLSPFSLGGILAPWADLESLLQGQYCLEKNWTEGPQSSWVPISLLLFSCSVVSDSLPPRGLQQANHLILCCPLFLLPSIFPSIMVFSNESALHIRWPQYWTFTFSISPSNEYSGLISFRVDWFDLLAVQGRRISSTTVKADVTHVGWASYSAKGFVYSSLSSLE